jgi:alpha-N-arabinofuranosidase
MSQYGRGNVLKPLLTCPKYDSKVYGEVPVLQMAVVLNQEMDEISVFILNCDQEDIEISMDFRSFCFIKPIEHMVLYGEDLSASNSFEEPEKVKPKSAGLPGYNATIFPVVLPKLSWNMLRFSTV